jgi:hypothetical protein
LPGEAQDEGRHPLMAQWSRVDGFPDRGLIVIRTPGSSQPSCRTPGARRDGSHWVQAGKGRSGETPVVLVEALEELPVSPSGPLSGQRDPWRCQDGEA